MLLFSVFFRRRAQNPNQVWGEIANPADNSSAATRMQCCELRYRRGTVGVVPVEELVVDVVPFGGLVVVLVVPGVMRV